MFILAYVLVILMALPGYYSDREPKVDDRTKELCRWYADLDHEKEFAPERWETHKEMIINYDWYTSCINHAMYPIAK